VCPTSPSPSLHKPADDGVHAFTAERVGMSPRKPKVFRQVGTCSAFSHDYAYKPGQFESFTDGQNYLEMFPSIQSGDKASKADTSVSIKLFGAGNQTGSIKTA
jgi:hypothetical protein